MRMPLFFQSHLKAQRFAPRTAILQLVAEGIKMPLKNALTLTAI